VASEPCFITDQWG